MFSRWWTETECAEQWKRKIMMISSCSSLFRHEAGLANMNNDKKHRMYVQLKT